MIAIGKMDISTAGDALRLMLHFQNQYNQMKQFIYCPECGMPILATVKSDLRLPEPLTKSYIFKCEYCECEGFDYEVMPARAVSIKQPWTYLVGAGIKPIENRTWPTKYRGPVLLHAGAQYDTRHRNMSQLFTPEQWENMRVVGGKELLNKMISSSFDKSAIIGIANIVDCVINHPSVWAEKTEGKMIGNVFAPYADCKLIYNWVMDKPILFEKPVLNVKGKLSFFIPTMD